MIDMASVYAKRFERNPQLLQAAVMGQSPDPKLDPYTALNALRLLKESSMMAMAGRAQQPTSSPSIVAETMAPQRGLGAMVPGAIGQAPQGMPPQMAQAPQAPVMQASGGLAGLPTPDEDYAAGGIVAFQEGGLNASAVTDDPLSRLLTEAGVTETAASDETEGNADMRSEAFENYLESRGIIKGIKDEDFTPEEAKAYRQDYLDFINKNAGPDIYKPAFSRLDTRESDRAKNLSQGQGLAMLAAAGAILEGNTLSKGAAKAFPTFAKEMGEVVRADSAEKRSIEQMHFALSDAQRKERMGDARGAQAAVETARKARADANRFKLNKAVALGTLDSKALQSLRPAGKGAGAGADKEQPVDRITSAMNDRLIELKAKNPDDPQIPILEAKIKGRKEILGLGKEGANKLPIETAKITSKENIAAQNALTDFKQFRKTAWKKYVEAHGGNEKTAEAAYKDGWMTKNPNAGSDDFDPDKAVEYIPTPKPAAAPSVKPGTRLKFNDAGEQIK